MAGLLLEFVEGSEAGRKAELDRALVIGRASTADLVLDDDQVSRRHARLSPDGEAARLEDLGSTNGTYVNDQVVAVQRQLVPGDRVRLGLTVLELRTRQQVAIVPSAVRPAPAITRLDDGVLRPEEAPVPPAAAPPAAPPPPVAEPAPVRSAPSPAQPPPFKVPERAPAYVPPEVAGDAQARSDFNALAALVDQRVKRRTTIAMFAILAIAALALVIFFGAQ